MLPFLAALTLALPQVGKTTVQSVLAEATPAAAAGARLRCVVAPDGTVMRCRTISSAGDKDQAETLRRAFERQKIVPAHDENGALYGIVETEIWADVGNAAISKRSELPESPLPDHYKISVAELPPALGRRFDLPLILGLKRIEPPTRCAPSVQNDPKMAAHCAGFYRVVSCTSAINVSQALLDTACERIRSGGFQPMRDTEGGWIERAVIPRTVEFTSGG